MLTLRLRIRFVLLCCLMAACAGSFWGQRVTVAPKAEVPAGWVDAGLAPISAPVQRVVVTLKRSDAQQADLNQYLSDVVQPGTASYHKWLTPAQFAERFQPAQGSVDAVSAWLSAQGFSVDTVSVSRLNIQAHGTVEVTQKAFATQLHEFASVDGQTRIATTELTLPAAVAAQVSTVEGVSQSEISADALSAWADFAAKVDANTDAVLTLKASTVCGGSADTLSNTYVPVLEQAAAQGITVLVSGTCVGGALPPGATALTTAVRAAGEAVSVSLAADGEARPAWQSVSGLPEERVRAVPDVSLSGDVDSLAQTLGTIVQKAGTRQGNVNSILYSLSAIKDVYDQPVSTWTASAGLGTVNLQKLLDVWPMGATATNVTLVSSSYAPIHGSSFTLTATVNNTTTTPTGTVTFKSSSTGVLSTVTLNGTQATYTSSTLDGGAYDFTAVYSGDTTYAGSTGGPATVTIQPEETQISATTSSVGLGQNIPVVITAKSASGVGTPTGTAYAQTTGSSSSQTYSAAFGTVFPGTASATVQVPATIAGNLTLIVKCGSPSSSFACNTNTTVQATVAKGTPTVTLSSTDGASSGSYKLTATVVGSSVAGVDAPTGSVTFKDGTTALATVALSSGTATSTVSFTGSTKHSITATYEGDNNYATTVSSPISLSGSLVTTTTAISADKYTGSNGTTITLTGTVSPASLVGSATPSGTITFTSSLQGVLGTVSVASYVGTLKISNLQAGTHNITATYNGDTNYAASTSTAATFTITAAKGTLAATISPTTAIGYGTTATVNAVVTTADGLAPGGTIQAVVSNGSTYTAALVPGTGQSTATITVDAPPPGTYSVVVSCVTSTSLTCSNTVTLTMKVVKGPTTTTLTVTPSAPVAGAQITLTANVAPTSSTSSGTLAAITGTVAFTSNGVSLGTATVTNGVATLTTTLKSGKSQSLVATYSGDANWASSASTAQVITPVPVDPTVTITANTLSPLANANVTLTAKVSPPAGTLLFPTGSVKFYDSYNGTLRLLGTVTLVSNGVDGSVATISSTGFTGGTHTVYAQYVGDDSFNAARSSDLALTTGDFAITINPSTLVINRGSSGTATGIVTVQGGFNGDISVACTPSAGTATSCLVSPGSVTGAGTVTITVTTTAATAVKTKAMTERVAGGIAVAMLLCGCMSRRSRRVRGVLFALVFLFGMTAMTGCTSSIVSGGGSGGGGGSGTGGSPLGTTIFTVTGAATDGSTVVRHSYSFQVTIQ